MAFISRPGKEGNATTYQGKVAAGYTTILAQEVDADFDAIYSAWNAGVDTVNIKDQSVTAAKLAPGAVTGTALAPGSITNAALAANSVQSVNIVDGTIVGSDIAANTLTDSLIANVAWTKLIAPFLSGLTLTPRVIHQATTDTYDIYANDSTAPAYDNTRPAWLLRLHYTDDAFELWRAPAGSTTYTRIFLVAADGHIAPPVARGSLAVNAIYGASAFSQCPAGYATNTPVGTWFTYMTLNAITTRGGNVALLAQHNLSCTAPTGGTTIAQRWIRGATPLQERAFQMSMAFPAYVPLPGMEQYDTPPAGTYTYAMQLFLGSGCAVASPPGSTQGFLQALEIG